MSNDDVIGALQGIEAAVGRVEEAATAAAIAGKASGVQLQRTPLRLGPATLLGTNG
jgi:hypothetical protein